MMDNSQEDQIGADRPDQFILPPVIQSLNHLWINLLTRRQRVMTATVAGKPYSQVGHLS